MHIATNVVEKGLRDPWAHVRLTNRHNAGGGQVLYLSNCTTIWTFRLSRSLDALCDRKTTMPLRTHTDDLATCHPLKFGFVRQSLRPTIFIQTTSVWVIRLCSYTNAHVQAYKALYSMSIPIIGPSLCYLSKSKSVR